MIDLRNHYRIRPYWTNHPDRLFYLAEYRKWWWLHWERIGFLINEDAAIAACKSHAAPKPKYSPVNLGRLP